MQAGGLKLGPDCDGMLNLCTPGICEGAKKAAEASRVDFALPALLASTALEDGYTVADVPDGVATEPSTYQLQARTLLQACSTSTLMQLPWLFLSEARNLELKFI